MKLILQEKEKTTISNLLGHHLYHSVLACFVCYIVEEEYKKGLCGRRESNKTITVQVIENYNFFS